MDFQNAVAPPTQYGAPSVLGQPAQQGQPQSGQPQMGPQTTALLAKAKQLLSSGQISADQYNAVASQAANSGELASSAGNMGAGMPQAAGQAPGAPMNIMPGQGG